MEIRRHTIHGKINESRGKPGMTKIRSGDNRFMRASPAAIIIVLIIWSFTQPVAAQKNRTPEEPPSQSIQRKNIPHIPGYAYRIVNIFPHDVQAFTQGLVFDEGSLYEGTGLSGKSELRRIKLDTGELLQSLKLQDRYFGEGITVFGDRLIQLTWRAKTGFVYDKNSFVLIRTFHYTTEGWGLTHDGKRLIMSDGTAYLYFLDPETFQRTGQIAVNDDQGPVTRLNELEYIRGEIYANVWQTNNIAIINPDTGRVKGWVDLGNLSRLAGGDKTVKTLNGIAYDKKHNRLFVTGKLWPRLYEIELIPLTIGTSRFRPGH